MVGRCVRNNTWNLGKKEENSHVEIVTIVARRQIDRTCISVFVQLEPSPRTERALDEKATSSSELRWTTT